MKKISLLLFILSFLNLSAFAMKEVKPTMEVKATYDDIKKTLGMVPTFLKEYPQDGIVGAWQDLKGLQLNPMTAIPPKYKELIGLAVAAQIPCKYCTYFHSNAAKLNNATNEELKEAIAMAAGTRRWSTFLNGTQVDEMSFKKEVDKMLEMAKQKEGQRTVASSSAPINTPEEAYRDMEKEMGFVPSFIKAYPQSAVVGAWKDMKGIEMNPNTAIPGKYKDLIGLAVSAQTPCHYCTYYHTKSAMFQGATEQEINEAVAMAGLTRQWSTYLNGLSQDEKQFRSEANSIFKYLKQKAPGRTISSEQ